MSKKTITEVIKFIGAVEDEWQLYSDNPSDYTVGRPIGFGASSVVYQAEYHPAAGERIQCALKVLDLDSLSSGALRLLQRETQLMSLSKHPNVLRVRGSWMDGHKLYIAMRLMRSGSVADVMRYKWTDGVEEEVAKCILKQALQGLNYLHVNKFIHRDIKAANLLVDDDGTVLLGDLGVAVALNEEEHTLSSTSGKTTWKNNPDAKAQGDGSHKPPPLRKRKSFVGTPCWMAPEVISQKSYDSKADIWSLGITALELAQGRPPRSRESAQRVLLKTVQEEPPSLDRRSARFKYSKAFDEFVQRCLQKNPNQRPTATELLQLPYFKTTKKKNFLVGALLSGLPPLVDRQERRRINTSVSRISVDSWDFSSTGPLSSPPSSIKLRPSIEIGILDIDGLPAKESSGKDTEVTEHILPYTQPDLPLTLEEDESVQGSTEGSTPGTSPATSYRSPSAMEKPPPTSRRSTANSGVLTSSPRLWQKLKELGSKVTDRESRAR